MTLCTPAAVVAAVALTVLASMPHPAAGMPAAQQPRPFQPPTPDADIARIYQPASDGGAESHLSRRAASPASSSRVTSWGRPATGWSGASAQHSRGEFRMVGGTGNTQWVEFNAAGAAAFHFVETNRDMWSVHLQDASRGVQIFIDYWRMKVTYADNSGRKFDLYNIIGEAKQDWRGLASLRGVDNQEKNDCWAFSATHAMQDRYNIEQALTGNGSPAPDLSVQQVVDCTPSKHGAESESSAADGGYHNYAMGYVVDSAGLLSEAAYPYAAADQVCAVKDSDQPYATGCQLIWNTWTACGKGFRAHSTTTRCGFLRTNIMCTPETRYKPTYASNIEQIFPSARSADAMEQELKHGPFTVAFRVYDSFYEHDSAGVNIYSCEDGARFKGGFPYGRGNYHGGHAVEVVGSGKKGSQEYWIIKNSWGADRHDNGFFYMAKGTNTCDVESRRVAYPQATAGQTQETLQLAHLVARSLSLRSGRCAYHAVSVISDRVEVIAGLKHKLQLRLFNTCAGRTETHRTTFAMGIDAVAEMIARRSARRSRRSQAAANAAETSGNADADTDADVLEGISIDILEDVADTADH